MSIWKYQFGLKKKKIESQIGSFDKFGTRNIKIYIIENLDENLTNE